MLPGGNIVGKVTSVDPPKRFVQTWRAPQWPENHFGTLTIGFDQGSSSTKLSLELEGVPVGKEDETEKGLDIYYIRSLKVSLARLTFHPALSAMLLTYGVCLFVAANRVSTSF